MKEEHERKIMTLKVNKPLFSIFMFSMRGLSHEIAIIKLCNNILCSSLLICTQDEMQAKHEQECQILEVRKPLYSSIVNFTVSHLCMLFMTPSHVHVCQQCIVRGVGLGLGFGLEKKKIKRRSKVLLSF